MNKEIGESISVEKSSVELLVDTIINNVRYQTRYDDASLVPVKKENVEKFAKNRETRQPE